MVRDTLTCHASPAEAARTAAEAKVETLVVFPCVPPPHGPVEAMITRGLAEIFPGRIVIARDGMTFDLPPKL
jgi:ribonuclease BN (tRNA processing enzyme)